MKEKKVEKIYCEFTGKELKNIIKNIGKDRMETKSELPNDFNDMIDRPLTAVVVGCCTQSRYEPNAYGKDATVSKITIAIAWECDVLNNYPTSYILVDPQDFIAAMDMPEFSRYSENYFSGHKDLIQANGDSRNRLLIVFRTVDLTTDKPIKNIEIGRLYYGTGNWETLTEEETRKVLEPDFYKPGTVFDLINGLKPGEVVDLQTTSAIYRFVCEGGEL